MITKEEMERLFREDFEALLKKHNASYAIVSNFRTDYTACVEITMYSEYDSEGNVNKAYSEFNL